MNHSIDIDTEVDVLGHSCPIHITISGNVDDGWATDVVVSKCELVIDDDEMAQALVDDADCEAIDRACERTRE
jgi:hypothetical protein